MSAPGHCASGMTGAAPPVMQLARVPTNQRGDSDVRGDADVIPLRPQGGVR